MSAISSMNSVPPSASSNFPLTLRSAPVKAPFSCPKSWLSSSVSESAAELKAMKEPETRLDVLWMARASIVLPVPVSPRMRIGRSVLAATRARSRQVCMTSSADLKSSRV